jgi:hypothetical protein
MGTWGVGPFQNDTAMDWFEELEEETSFSVIRRKIEEVITDDYLEADLTSEAIASIAIITAIKTNDARLVPDFETSSLDSLRDLFLPKIDDNLLSLCEDALGIIKRNEDNEMYDLFLESDELELWMAHLDDLEERLFN